MHSERNWNAVNWGFNQGVVETRQRTGKPRDAEDYFKVNRGSNEAFDVETPVSYRVVAKHIEIPVVMFAVRAALVTRPFTISPVALRLLRNPRISAFLTRFS